MSNKEFETPVNSNVETVVENEQNSPEVTLDQSTTKDITADQLLKRAKTEEELQAQSDSANLTIQSRSFWKDAWIRFKRNRLAIVSI